MAGRLYTSRPPRSRRPPPSVHPCRPPRKLPPSSPPQAKNCFIISEAERAKLLGAYPGLKTPVILSPNGVNMAIFKPPTLKREEARSRRDRARDHAEIAPRCCREISPRCHRDLAEIALRSRRDVAEILASGVGCRVHARDPHLPYLAGARRAQDGALRGIWHRPIGDPHGRRGGRWD